MKYKSEPKDKSHRHSKNKLTKGAFGTPKWLSVRGDTALKVIPRSKRGDVLCNKNGVMIKTV